jgi:hypothetical protein
MNPVGKMKADDACGFMHSPFEWGLIDHFGTAQAELQSLRQCEFPSALELFLGIF